MTREKMFKIVNSLRAKGYSLGEIKAHLEEKGIVNEAKGRGYSIGTIRKAYADEKKTERISPKFQTIPVNESAPIPGSKIIAIIGQASDVLDAIRGL